MKIVIVEDEIRSREGLVHLLGKLGENYKVVGAAENGEEGIRIICEVQPDLIITDIKMPVMDGLAMLEKLREYKIQAKVIVLSAFAEFAYAQKAITYGVEEYLLKPIAVNGLITALDKIAQKLGIKNTKSDVFQKDVSPMVQRACNILASPQGKTISLNELAAKLKVTPEYLSVQFCKEMGCHFSEYSKNIRLDYAKCLLRNTNIKIADIAMQCGYVDTKYFSQLFRKENGVLPVEYRRQA